MPDHIPSSKPDVHSRISIIVFSFLLSTVFGALMYSQNLSAIDKRSQRVKVILFGLAWQFLMFQLLKNILGNPGLSIFIINLIGGVLIAKPIWDYHFKDVEDFETKNIWTPLAIVVIIYGSIIGLNLLIPKAVPTYAREESVSNEACNRVKEGRFRLDQFVIERKGKIQREHDPITGKESVYAINWLNDCEYELTEGGKSNVIRIKIIEVNDDSYECVALSQGESTRHKIIIEH